MQSQNNKNSISGTKQKINHQNPSQEDADAIDKYARNGNPEMLDQIFEKISSQGKTTNQRTLNNALFAAVEGCNSTTAVESHINCMNTLISQGAQLNAEKSNKTILMIAVSKGYIEMVSDILSRKEAWVQQKDGDQKSALHYAIDNQAENYDIVQLLLQQNLDVNIATTSEGLTPLMLAVRRGFKQIAGLLINAGAELSLKDLNHRNTVLHMAVEQEDPKMVQQLVNEHNYQQLGSLRNKENLTPLELIQQRINETSQEQFSKENINDQRRQKQNQEVLEYLQGLESQLHEKTTRAGDSLIQEEIKQREDLIREKKAKKNEKQQANQLLKVNSTSDTQTSPKSTQKIQNNKNKKEREREYQQEKNEQQQQQDNSIQKQFDVDSDYFDPVESGQALATESNKSKNSQPSIQILQNPNKKNKDKKQKSEPQESDKQKAKELSLSQQQSQVSDKNIVDEKQDEDKKKKQEIDQKKNKNKRELEISKTPEIAKTEQEIVDSESSQNLNKKLNMQNKSSESIEQKKKGGESSQTPPNQSQKTKQNQKVVFVAGQNNKKPEKTYSEFTPPVLMNNQFQNHMPQSTGLQNQLGGILPMFFNGQQQVDQQQQQMQGLIQTLGGLATAVAIQGQQMPRHQQPMQFNNYPNGQHIQGILNNQQQNMQQTFPNQQSNGLQNSKNLPMGQNNQAKQFIGNQSQINGNQNPMIGHPIIPQHAPSPSQIGVQPLSAIPLTPLNQIGQNVVGDNLAYNQQQILNNLIRLLPQQYIQNNYQMNRGGVVSAQGALPQANLLPVHMMNTSQNLGRNSTDHINQPTNNNFVFNTQQNIQERPSDQNQQSLRSPPLTNAQAQGGIPTNTSTQQRLPIRVHVDLSDEKLLQCFIYRQKYNMKKNEFHNLEKRYTYLLQTLKEKDQKIEELTTQNKKLQDQNQQSARFGKFDEELSMTRLIESHNQQVKLLDQNRQLCLNLGSASMHAKELLQTCLKSAKIQQKEMPPEASIKDLVQKIENLNQEIQKSLIGQGSADTPSSEVLAADAAQSDQVELVNRNIDIDLFKAQLVSRTQASNILLLESRYEMCGKDLEEKQSKIFGKDEYQRLKPLKAPFVEYHSRFRAQQVKEILHNEILLFKQDSNCIYQEMKEVKNLIIRKLEGIIKSRYEDDYLEEYGSNPTGLCLHWSDIDLMIRAGTKHQHNPLNDIYDCIDSAVRLQGADWLSKTDYIRSAKRPVIKISISVADFLKKEGIKLVFPKNQKYASLNKLIIPVDLTMWDKEHMGKECVSLVRDYLDQCWIIEPLILVLKQLLNINGMNEPWTGGLSSYGLLLLLVYFLKKHRYYQPSDPTTVNLGEILLSFLLEMSHLEYQQIKIKTNKAKEAYEEEQRNEYFGMTSSPWVENPLYEQSNVTSSTYEFLRVQKLFRLSYQAAFLGCFCNNHFNHQTDALQQKQWQEEWDMADQAENYPLDEHQPYHLDRQYDHFQKYSAGFPSLKEFGGMYQAPIRYIDPVDFQRKEIYPDRLYKPEGIYFSSKCDSILAKILYSYAQYARAHHSERFDPALPPGNLI